MPPHLSREELLLYLTAFACEEEIDPRISTHVDSCRECRNKVEQAKRRLRAIAGDPECDERPPDRARDR